ncbi:MAG: serine/threonine protein phosphatase [Deltaproteobacteria bacterium]|nr:serine/threonine protein phosphatase [Deltaproteobacteria bacterium]
MTKNKTFIIGDIHGCLSALLNLIEKIKWRPDKDRLIFLGDYIDRGEDSKGVVDYILSLINQSSNIQCLKGNHEDMLLNYLNDGDIRTFLYNGGKTTLASYTRNNGDVYFPSSHIAFYQSLLTMIELDEYYVVHAGFQPGIEIQDQDERDLLWIRDSFIFSDYDFGKKVIFGHTPFSDPLIMDTKIGLDTGAVYGNRLTCLELPSFRFHSVEA